MHRDAGIIFIGLLIALIAGALLMFSFKEGALAPSGSFATAFAVLGEGTDSGMIDDRQNYRIKSAEELSSLWGLVYGTDGPLLPQVDFSREEVLAAFDGTHASGGYAIAFDSIVDEPGARIITIRHTAPGTGCVTTQAITSPFTIIRVEKSTAPLTRRDVEETIECE